MKCTSEKDRAAAWTLFRPLDRDELEMTKLAFDRPIFYDTWGRRGFREYFCPNCGRFESEKGGHRDIYQPDDFEAHHGDQIECPVCGYVGELVCLGRIRNFSTLKTPEKIMWMHSADGWLIIDCGYAVMDYSFDNLDPYPDVAWNARYAIKPGKRLMWRSGVNWGNGWHGGEERHRQKRWSEPFPGGFYGSGRDESYHVFNADCIEQTDMRHCAAVEMWEKELGVDLACAQETRTNKLISYLGLYAAYPQCEMLVKLGHTDVIRNTLETGVKDQHYNWRAKTPWEFFGLTRGEYKAFRVAGAEAKTIRAWKEVMPQESLQSYFGYLGVWGRNLAEAVRVYGKDKRWKRLTRWFSAQKKEYGCDTWRLWRDTLRLEGMLGNDVSHDDVLMPLDIGWRHDRSVELVNELEMRKREDTKKEYTRVRLPLLRRRWSWTDGTLLIDVPKSAEEIDREGRLLKHCVAGYADRHIKGIKCILFLRWCDDPETAYVTVEVDEEKVRIVQAHGYANERHAGQMRPGDIHAEFFEEWLEWARAGSPRLRNGKPKKLRKEEVA